MSCGSFPRVASTGTWMWSCQPAAYIDVDVLMSEIEQLDFPRERIRISNYARIVTERAQDNGKTAAKLAGAIGSTGSGVGAAVMASVARSAGELRASSPLKRPIIPKLAPFVCDTSDQLRGQSRRGISGHRGGYSGLRGLSLLEGGFWPKATSRSTTAAGALAEAGLSPVDVDDVTMVIRSYPIRVAGNSGPLLDETTWKDIAGPGRKGRRPTRVYDRNPRRLRQGLAASIPVLVRAGARRQLPHPAWC